MDDHDTDGLSSQPTEDGAYREYVSVVTEAPPKSWRSSPNEKKRPRRFGESKSARNSKKRDLSKTFSEASNGRSAGRLSESIIGSSPQALKLREKIALYADETAPVLITGETGVGKELAARALHQLSARARARFMPVNLAAVPETLAAEEFFGHVKGAFTGAMAEREGVIEAADGGTLFLDEIGDMPLRLQSHLLRVLDDGHISRLGSNELRSSDFRLVAATNVCLQTSLDKGEFRRDLYYRINVLPLEIPPLRERGDDVIEIVERYILNHPNEKYRRCRLTPKAADWLRAQRFPGNMRELKNVVHRALVIAQSEKILPEHFALMDAGDDDKSCALSLDIDDAKDLVSRVIILSALRQTGGNVAMAAEMVQRSRATVHAVKKTIKGGGLAEAHHTACAEMKSLLQGC